MQFRRHDCRLARAGLPSDNLGGILRKGEGEWQAIHPPVGPGNQLVLLLPPFAGLGQAGRGSSPSSEVQCSRSSGWQENS